MFRFRRRSGAAPQADAAPGSGGPAAVTAEFHDGPLEGRRLEVQPVEGRPPKTVDVEAEDGGSCRYCLAEWTQTGDSAAYTFLYRV